MDMSVVFFLAIALTLVALMRKSGISSLIAFLFAGMIAGPHALGLYQVSGVWNFLGSLGVAFLWFALGLELNINRLWTLRKGIFGLGAPSVGLVSLVLFPLIFLSTDWPVMGAVMVCLMLSMSSTGADLQALADRDELQTKLGRRAFSMILFQDLLSIPILAMLPVFAGKSLNLGADVIDVFVLTIGLIFGVVLFARIFVNPIMRLVAKLKSREATLLAVLLNIALCVAAFHVAGMPVAIGAFLAGMLFSETVYNHQVRADIAPYQMLFVALFFITLGMTLNLSLLASNWLIIAAFAIALVLIKFSAIYFVARLRESSAGDAFLIALILAQGGEFGLLILQTMRVSGIEAVPLPHTEIITAVIIVSMITTPLLLGLRDFLCDRGAFYSARRAKKYNGAARVKNPAVIICGFGRVGQTVAKMLCAKKIPHVAIDINVDQVMRGREAGFNVVYGDSTRSDVLSEFGLSPRTTKGVIIALDNAAVAKKAVRAVRRIARRVRIFARARNLQESKILMFEGARTALPETIESAFLLGGGLLSALGVGAKDIGMILARLRKDGYQSISN
ncbi:MAG: cation:proton antiporter [Rickettsiales bacterium]|jgi:Kef-type K+ transport system membrane component KefB|nr:cation:proton antiporter [Rickettsiales bacterium]